MRILQLCHKPPRPAIDGGCIAMDNLTKGLVEAGHDVKILCASTHKHPFRPSELSKVYKKITSVEAVYIDTRLNFVDAFSNLITRDSYNISRFFSPDFDMKLERILRKDDDFDIIQLESLFMTPYISTVRRFSKSKIILRSHNLEYKIWQRMAKVSSTGPKKAYLNLLAKRLKEYEVSIMGQVDGIATISPEDTGHYMDLGCDIPIETVPFGIDSASYEVSHPYNFDNTLFHLGAMDWMPNIEGVEWFLREIWPSIKSEHPELKLHLAGKASNHYQIDKDTRSVVLDGEVECAKKYMQSKGIMIVPLLSGGGIRIKIIEGMALGKVIISTSIGAEGIGVTNGKNILLADSPAEFQKCLNDLLVNPHLMNELSRNARSFIERNFDNSILTRNLLAFYSKIQTAELEVLN
ncbi:MAG: glycosyltransferase family 4 protein [Flavobacteriales bacterium]|nr:glycosyltransferase family 4 protein [Flavobacteriales bacterium]